MTLLKKIGSLIGKGLVLVGKYEGILPAMAGPVVAAVKSELSAMAKVIVDIEVAGQALGLSGPQKLTAATPAVTQIVLDSGIVAHREIANEALFRESTQKLTDALAGILNSLKPE